MNKILKIVAIGITILLATNFLNDVYSRAEMTSSNVAVLECNDDKNNSREETSVTPVVPDGPLEPTQPYTYKVVTTSTDLNVRKGPGTNYAIVGTVKKGSYVECSFMQSASSGKWMYGTGKDAKTGKKISGYMHSDYLKCVTQG